MNHQRCANLECAEAAGANGTVWCPAHLAEYQAAQKNVTTIRADGTEQAPKERA